MILDMSNKKALLRVEVYDPEDNWDDTHTFISYDKMVDFINSSYVKVCNHYKLKIYLSYE